MRNLSADFDLTFNALEDGLQVEHIAEFDLKTCPPSSSVAAILEDPALEAFDQFPVRDGQCIVGVLCRHHVRNGRTDGASVEDVMSPLSSAMLTAKSQPVVTLLDAFGDSRYRLVVKGSEIAGIVTPSDLLKLPVRLYAFMLVTHLELLMAASIRQRFRNQPADAWMSQLSEGRRNKLQQKIAEFTKDRLDPDPLELTEFCDKRDLVKRWQKSKRQFVRDLEAIERLRNSVAHGGNYLGNQNEMDEFLTQIRLARHHIEQLSGTMVG